MGGSRSKVAAAQSQNANWKRETSSWCAAKAVMGALSGRWALPLRVLVHHWWTRLVGGGGDGVAGSDFKPPGLAGGVDLPHPPALDKTPPSRAAPFHLGCSRTAFRKDWLGLVSSGAIIPSSSPDPNRPLLELRVKIAIERASF